VRFASAISGLIVLLKVCNAQVTVKHRNAPETGAGYFAWLCIAGFRLAILASGGIQSRRAAVGAAAEFELATH
jgi:hypothetical protein